MRTKTTRSADSGISIDAGILTKGKIVEQRSIGVAEKGRGVEIKRIEGVARAQIETTTGGKEGLEILNRLHKAAIDGRRTDQGRPRDVKNDSTDINTQPLTSAVCTLFGLVFSRIDLDIGIYTSQIQLICQSMWSINSHDPPSDSSIPVSLSLNFWIFPLAVFGYSVTLNTYFGTK